MGPHPAVAAIRLAVRRTLSDVLHGVSGVPDGFPDGVSGGVPDGVSGVSGVSGAPSHRRPPLVLVACSGGADSMALASALAFEAPRLGLRAGGVTVDHGLQPGSGDRAREVVSRLTEFSLEPAEALTVTVGRGGGPEAAARAARYAALDEAAERLGAAAVLLGHTRDDQAETVLLGLARGSGTRSLSGMAAVSGSPAGRPGARHRYLRPFLAVDRQTTRKACMVQSLPVWDDPHNADPAFTRSRVRHDALPALEKALGKGVVEALARTAQLSRDDADALDAWAREAEREVLADVRPSPEGRGGRDGANVADVTAGAGAVPDAGPGETSGSVLDVVRLGALPPAVRRRVLRRVAVAAGSPAGSLFARHLEEVDRLVTDWHGQRAINLPGRVAARRQGGTLVIRQV